MTLFPTQPNIPSPTTAARPVAVPAPGVSAPLGADDAKRARILADAIRARFAQTLVGQDNLRESLIVTLVAGGHILIESVPGLAKTTAAQTLATCVSGSFKRVQCTPDLMPSDLVGTQVFDFASQKFTTQIGPIHANFVLLDEINRSNAKTQSAMLEIMEERQVTADGATYKLERPFMVLATQNPIDSLGTYKLPDAQIDRFMIKISLGYPSFEDEMAVILSGRKAKAEIAPTINAQQVVALIEQARRVCVDRTVAAYIVRMVEATRTHADIKLGASPRGSIALYCLSRAYALSRGRNYVLPDDVKFLAPYVLAHRIILTHGAKTEKKDPAQIIRTIVGQVVVPTGTK